MNNTAVESLRAALQHSPDNIPLRLLLADTLASLDRLQEAEEEYTAILQKQPDVKAKVGLARLFFKKSNFSACNVILEDVIDGDFRDVDVLVLYAKALLRGKETEQAQHIYERVLSINTNYFDEELDNAFRIKSIPAADDEEEQVSQFLQKPDVKFADVGGMEQVKKEIELKIVKPLLHPELYKAYGKKTGGGILLYGPPGCGKTFLAKATAGEVNARFISIGLNDILDMWIGNSEKNLHAIFELARANTPCVLFIDEIDALGASRSDMKQSAGRHLINQFLQELDGINSNNEGILVLGATNTPWNLDAAFRRPGRFDRIIFVPPPDAASREAILRVKLESKPTEALNYAELAKRTNNFSGADLEALIDLAIEQKLEASFVDGIPKPITTKDLVQAGEKQKPSTLEWFKIAKNYVMFANEGGLYDDVLDYLKKAKLI